MKKRGHAPRRPRPVLRLPHPEAEEAEIGGLTAAEVAAARARERAREIERRDADVKLRRDAGVALRRPVRLDKEQLEQLAGVEFSWSDIQELVELATIYMERFRVPVELPAMRFGDPVELPTRLELPMT